MRGDTGDAPVGTVGVLGALLSETVTVLDAVSGRVLRVPSRVPPWTRGMLVAHLAHGASTTRRLVDAALAGAETVWYPGGTAEREASLRFDDQDSSADLVDRAADAAAILHDRWFDLTPDQWTTGFDEPRIGSLTVDDLVGLRATEVLVHGVDLGIGHRPEQWPFELVAAVTPWRVEFLARRRRDPAPEPGHRFTLTATDLRRSWHVETSAERVITVEEIDGASAADDGPHLACTARQLLLVLTGRVPANLIGDRDVADRFVAAFPGP